MFEGHGDDIYSYDGLVRINFSSNIYQHADLSALRDHLMSHFDVVRNYPEPQPLRLEQLIAEYEGVTPKSVLVTNGVSEAIYLIAQLFHGSTSIIPQPTFSEYANACHIHHHIITYENTDDVVQLPRDRVYWLCNPNNPSGNVLMKGFVDYLVRRSPRYTFVVDQSYEAFTQEPLLRAREMSDTPNLLLLHSFSKKYGIPGLRLGYVTGHPNTVELLRSLRHPWAVNALTIEAGLFLLEHGRPAVDNLEEYLLEAERLRTNLNETDGIRVFETKTNYMLCEMDDVKAADLKDYLIRQHGMLIRDCSNFHGLSPHFFRVAAQSPQENDALVAAIKEYMKDPPPAPPNG